MAGLAAALAARPPAERALHDGHRWLSVGDLVPDVAGAAPPADGAVPVDGALPHVAVRALAGALQAGRTPVVVPPGAGPDGVAALLAAAAALPAGHLVLPTSGTTSAPRAVLRTVASWDAALEPFTAVTGSGAGDVAWAPGPATSTLTLWALWHALSAGVPVVATGPWRGVPAGPGVLDGVTVLHCVPAVLADVLVAREAGALPALRTAVVAGAAVPGALRARTAGQGVRLVEYYGAAELSFVAVDADGAGLRPFPGCEVRVRGGELEVLSPYVSLGYLVPGTDGPWRRTADGWAGVGDQGRIGAGGVVEVAGRGDAALSVGGQVVLTADVERTLGAVEGVLDVACWGTEDARLGQRACAAVATDLPVTAHPALLTRLRAAARAGLPAAARPVRYAVVPALPRTPAGKPDLQRVRALVPATTRTAGAR